MCFIHGLANGQYLLDEEFLKPENAVEAHCTCAQEHAHGGSTRRQAISRGALGAGAAIIGSTILGKAAISPGSAGAAGPTTGDRIVMLGVNGGPVVSPIHAQTSTALRISGKNDAIYLVDCGFETPRQMVLATNLPFKELRHVFITHHHSDHTSGFAPLALHGLVGNNGVGFRRLDFWGPRPVARMLRDFNSMYELDIKSRVVSGAPNLTKLLHSHQQNLPKRGVRKIMEDGNVIVHATLVKHGADMPGACAYRFTIKKTGRAIVFSGDTAPSQNLIDLAKDAHTLVHECISLPGVEILLAGVDEKVRGPLRKHVLGTHTDVFEVPKVAKAAGVQRLILNHFSPAFFPASRFLADAKTGAAKVGFTGEILASNEFESYAV